MKEKKTFNWLIYTWLIFIVVVLWLFVSGIIIAHAMSTDERLKETEAELEWTQAELVTCNILSAMQNGYSIYATPLDPTVITKTENITPIIEQDYYFNVSLLTDEIGQLGDYVIGRDDVANITRHRFVRLVGSDYEIEINSEGYWDYAMQGMKGELCIKRSIIYEIINESQNSIELSSRGRVNQDVSNCHQKVFRFVAYSNKEPEIVEGE